MSTSFSAFAHAHPTPQVEKMMTCRVDHYQTLSQVHVSVFAKQADKERSAIKFEQTQVTGSASLLDLVLTY